MSAPLSANEDVEATSAASDTYNVGSAAGEEGQHRARHSTTRAYKFQTKFNRPFLEGEGPSDAANSQNYNQKLTTFIQDELDYCKVDNANHNIEVVASNIEKYFKDSLIRRFDQIQELKQQIARQHATNARKEKAKKALLEKHKQSRSS